MGPASTETQRVFLTERWPLKLRGPATDHSWEAGFHTPETEPLAPMRLEYELGPGVSAEVVTVVAEVLGGWRLHADLEVGENGLTVSAIDLRPHDGPDIGTRLLRQLGLSELLDRVERWLQDPWFVHHLGPAWDRQVKRPGRAGRPDAFYALWAQRYVDALAIDASKPVKVLVDQGAAVGEHLTPQQVRWYLTEARKRGLLTPAPSGGAGGELTPKGAQLLDGMEPDTKETRR